MYIIIIYTQYACATQYIIGTLKSHGAIDFADSAQLRMHALVPRLFPYARGGVWERDYSSSYIEGLEFSLHPPTPPQSHKQSPA